ncbi:hypothetical protein [Evansella halocellulosilytica]|uniref:hypothetical protein n=1 Tax=Evansella halocellulosilytica TaxID=2011013 RepID=UPI000BB81B72|nr:hypothetical protein [Evansella halocellulosilytica]
MLCDHYQIKGLYNQLDPFKEIINKFMIPSEEYTWQERVEHICGKSFHFQAFEEQLSQGLAAIFSKQNHV